MKKAIFPLCALLFLLLLPLNAFADGDPNIDGGGGDMGGGTGTNSWTPGRDGVRVTIVRDSDNQAVSSSIDFANCNTGNIEIHFGTVNKISYRSGQSLPPKQGGYYSIKPAQSMPAIVSSSGGSNIAAVKNYFCRSGTIEDIADATGFNYDMLISGEYKIMLEPIAYFKYEGVMYAMTATEAALFDQKVSGALRNKMGALSHKNLPLAMFLEYDELGFSAWNGSKASIATNENIISYLGIGIIRFSELDEPETQESEIKYRVDTDVIISVNLSTGSEKTPIDPAYATFSIDGNTYSHSNIYIPENGSQLAWVKWRTPPAPGIVTISITSNCMLSTSEIVAEIADLNQNIPPDPQANDRNDGYSIPSAPGKANVTTLTWGEWDCWWHEYWVWIPVWDWCDHGEDDGHWVDNGYWEDQGWWDYAWIPYSATLSATMEIKPDEKSPTATAVQMKSGYGFNMNVSSSMYSGAPSGHITGAQNVVSYFPEFNYETYWRLLARLNTGFNSTFELQKNIYSTYYRPVHFTPVWFPDGQYTAYAEILDAWTPAGMLQINPTASLTINDNLFSDWHVRPIK